MLTLDRLVRRFGDHTAVDEVSFTVAPGSMTGFVGGNGAGKTTTMRMVMGVLSPTAGEVRWHDRAITAADRRNFGYMPEERGLYPKQKIGEQLTYLGQLHGMSRTDARRAAEEHLERFNLADRAKEPLEKLSLGNQQRVQIAAAVMSQPACLILDEPFSGLDPDAVDSMAELLRAHADRGVPVLFSSHQLDLVDRLVDHLVILARGKVVASGSVEELRASGPQRHRLEAPGDLGWVAGLAGVDVVAVATGSGASGRGSSGSEATGADGASSGAVVVELDSEAAGQALLAEAMRRGPVHAFAPVRPTLSEIYREASA